MQISHRYKFIFFSNPKTGSESVRKMLKPFADEKIVPFTKLTSAHPFYSHITPRETKQIFEALQYDFNAYKKFVFVRNPWARLVSAYENIKYIHYENTTAATWQKPSFEDWLLNTRPNSAGGGGKDNKRWLKYGTYSADNYLMDEEKKKLLVDKIIRLEDINQELIPYLKEIGIPKAEKLKIPGINKRSQRSWSSGAPYTKYYNEKTKKYVRDNYQYDITHFNYYFGD